MVFVVDGVGSAVVRVDVPVGIPPGEGVVPEKRSSVVVPLLVAVGVAGGVALLLSNKRGKK